MKKIIKYIALLLVLAPMASCEDFLDVNTDPNNPTKVSPQLVLPVAQSYTAQLMYSNRRVSNLGNMMVYNWSQSDGFAWYPDEFKYLVTTSFYQGIFNDSYTRPLKQYQILAQLEGEYGNFKAIGEIMKAYHFQLLVDMYGDVPYTEALQRSLEATPKYDDAKTIYENLIVKLTEAIATIKASDKLVTPGASDVMFQGNMTKWIQFANSLKMRILVRQSLMAGRGAYITQQITAITTEGSGFITADVGINPGYVKEESKQNPLWDTFGTDAGGVVTMNNNATCATDYTLKYLQDNSDPRIDRLYEKPASGHLGVPQGLLDYDTPVADRYVFSKVSNIGPGVLKGFNQAAVIMTLAECNFNRAEAVQRGLTAGDAQALYEAGVQASFTFLGAGSAAAYLVQPVKNVSWANSTDKIEAIITQKWIASNGNNAEQAWFDHTRTGFPLNLPLSLLASTSNRPVRLFYPAGEISSNGANVPKQPDAFTAKIFWGN